MTNSKTSPWGRWRRSRQRDVVYSGCREWGVGCRAATYWRLAFGSGITNNPHRPSPRGGSIVLRCSSEPRRGVGCRGWDVGWPRIKNRTFGSSNANNPPTAEPQTQPWLNDAAWTPARAAQNDPLGRGHELHPRPLNPKRIPGRTHEVGETRGPCWAMSRD